MTKIVKTVLTNFWQIVFKAILVPAYKLFLYFKKIFTAYLIHNPYLPIRQNIINFKEHTPAHLVMFLLLLFTLLTNLSTRDTYAGDFNRKSIIAQMFITNVNEEIVEKAPDIKTVTNRPKTDSVLNELSALEASRHGLDERDLYTSSIIAFGGGEAVAHPNLSPFEKPDEAASNDSRTEIIVYLVQAGDTLSQIAKKFDLSVNTLLWENNLSLNSYLRPGDKLSILPVNGLSYIIRAGDTLGSIAKKYNTTTDKIITYNNLSANSLLKIKQKLILPDAKPLSQTTAPTRSIYDKKSATTPSSSNFIWPTHSKRITQYYNWRHAALDIGDKNGHPIYAIAAGRVERAGWNSGYGYNIIITHGNGFKTLYAHLSAMNVKHGDQIEQGEVIGAVGSTGWSTGPHLHLEIILNGRKVNPLSYL